MICNKTKATTIYLRKPNYSANTGFTATSTAKLRIEDSSSEGWELDIVMSNQNQRTNLGGIGMRKLASEGIDKHDKFLPPLPSSEFAFHWEDEQGLFRNIVGLQESYTWEYAIKTNGGFVKLAWDNKEVADRNSEVWMELLPQRKYVNLQKTSEVSFMTTPNQLVRIYYGVMPEMFDVEACPNPVDKELSITMNSSFEGTLYEEVTNINGTLIRTDVRNVKPGSNQWKWDLKDSKGVKVESGLYFYKVSSNDGQNEIIKLIVK